MCVSFKMYSLQNMIDSSVSVFTRLRVNELANSIEKTLKIKKGQHI